MGDCWFGVGGVDYFCGGAGASASAVFASAAAMICVDGVLPRSRWIASVRRVSWAARGEAAHSFWSRAAVLLGFCRVHVVARSRPRPSTIAASVTRLVRPGGARAAQKSCGSWMVHRGAGAAPRTQMAAIALAVGSVMH